VGKHHLVLKASTPCIVIYILYICIFFNNENENKNNSKNKSNSNSKNKNNSKNNSKNKNIIRYFL
jgi:hypothetical protein